MVSILGRSCGVQEQNEYEQVIIENIDNNSIDLIVWQDICVYHSAC